MNRSNVGYVDNIERELEENGNFRKVLYTCKHQQLVVMSLKPGEDIGQETHAEHDQFIRVESGTGEAILNGEVNTLSDGDAVIIPAGVEHNIINRSTTDPMKLYTLYSPPEHPADRVDPTKVVE